MSVRTASHLGDETDRIVDAHPAIETQNLPGRTRVAVEYVQAAFEALDIETERIEADPAKPNLLERIPGENREPPVPVDR